jgi:hypothetical protein
MSDDSWAGFLKNYEKLKETFKKSPSILITNSSLRGAVRELVQNYFRVIRNQLTELNFDDVVLEPIDQSMQKLIVLSGSRNRRSSYLKVFVSLAKEIQNVEIKREMKLGQQISAGIPQLSSLEGKIINTLEKIVPSAALSYKQAIRDLLDTSRVSYRGTANEIRETLREVLQHLAPDNKVMAEQGFALEKEQTKPTHRQKVEFIFKKRLMSKEAMKIPITSISLVETLTAIFARSLYERTSVSTHVLSMKSEVNKLKNYIDGLLAEILELN